MMRTCRFFGLALFVLGMMPRIAGAAQTTLVPQPHYGGVAQKVARVLPAAHLSQKPLNDAISQVAWTNLLNAFDFDHSYFLQSDIDAFIPMRTQIDYVLKAGDV